VTEVELTRTSEVAALLGVSRQHVLVIARQAGFLEPLAVLKMGKVWRGSDTCRWTLDRRSR